MSILILDHTTRLNLHTLIGAQRANVDDMRLWWRVQDRIELSPDEKLAIGYQVHTQNGQHQITWDVNCGLAPREFEFSQDEFQRIAKVVREWQPGFMISADRIWLQPLLEQFENGQPANLQVR